MNQRLVQVIKIADWKSGNSDKPKAFEGREMMESNDEKIRKMTVLSEEDIASIFLSIPTIG